MRPLLVCAAVAAAGCAAPAVRPVAVPPAPVEIHLTPDGWAPAREVHVAPGRPVRIVNSSGRREGIGVTGPGADGPLVRHQVLLPGEAFDVRLTEPGEYAVRMDEPRSIRRRYQYVRIFVR
jgi:hypothetical protein